MKKFRLRTVIIFALAALSGAALFHTSQSVQDAEDRLALLKAQTEKEEEAIRVLEAEWEYLNNPARLEHLATEYLDLQPPTPDQMKDGPADLPVSAVPESPRPLLQHVSDEPPPPLAVKPAHKPKTVQPKTISEKPARTDDFRALMDKFGGEGAP